MTVKELIEKLKEFPGDKEVVIWGEKGFDNGYDEWNTISGLFPVSDVHEVRNALKRDWNGKVKIDIVETLW